jgi:hypothetical protein
MFKNTGSIDHHSGPRLKGPSHQTGSAFWYSLYEYKEHECEKGVTYPLFFKFLSKLSQRCSVAKNDRCCMPFANTAFKVIQTNNLFHKIINDPFASYRKLLGSRTYAIHFYFADLFNFACNFTKRM